MTEKRIYQPLPEIEDRQQAREVLASGDLEDIRLLPLAFCNECEEQDKVFAQELCLEIADHEDMYARANAIMGLAYIARRHQWLDKRLVKPYILRELKENLERKSYILNAIEDINLYLGWRLARKTIPSPPLYHRDPE
ncbi:hypothetical protein [Kiloniella sp.]|uniref:hypothetical protein n=1 Tax=Kiloniella sp. TaxID=1938587 RepID=UPI003B02E41A